MTSFPQFEVAISNNERAEIEALFIELMRQRENGEHLFEDSADPLIEAHKVDTSDGATGRAV